MIQFETNRLIVRSLTALDSNGYFDMMGNPNVMNLIPSKVMTREESDTHLQRFIDNIQTESVVNAWAIQHKTEMEFIGLCAFLKNDKKEDEIGYRFREKYWRRGFGTEITKGLIVYGFEQLNMNKITADVDTRNLNSIKILEKYMTLSGESFNEMDNCIDRRYEVFKRNWTL